MTIEEEKNKCNLDSVQNSDTSTDNVDVSKAVEEKTSHTREKAMQTLVSMRSGEAFYLTPEQLTEALTIEDLTLEEHGPNPITLILKNLTEKLAEKFEIKPEVRRSSPLVTVQQNFDDLLFPPDSISRSPIYTRYVDSNTLLRTHTSSMIPAILAEKPAQDDRLLVCPGICFRRDVVDKIHTGTPHQIDVWRIRKGRPRIDREDLIELIETILGSVFPNPTYRVNETSHPYTLDGVEIEVLHKGNWLEILEAGLAHPQVLKNAGIDPDEYSGLASGFGLDRLAMLAKGIDDLRILRSKDPRIVQQMRTMEPYKEVSRMPPMKRDITVVVDSSLTIEDITEKIWRAVGQNKVDLIEEITILSETSYEQLPPVARERLGAKEGQKNLLIRIVIRSINRTLVKKEADTIRDLAYLAVHESDVKILIGQ